MRVIGAIWMRTARSMHRSIRFLGKNGRTILSPGQMAFITGAGACEPVRCQQCSYLTDSTVLYRGGIIKGQPPLAIQMLIYISSEGEESSAGELTYHIKRLTVPP